MWSGYDDVYRYCFSLNTEKSVTIRKIYRLKSPTSEEKLCREDDDLGLIVDKNVETAGSEDEVGSYHLSS